ncbi:MAG TPA: serine hydrolase domain-containing protein [Actinomycetota bacterium]
MADKLEAKAASFVKEHRLPGAAVGVVRGDGLVWSAGVGFADVGERRAPEPTTLYRIASITKTFTGTAIMQLRDEGRLHLDDPAVSHLPELRGAASPFGPIETLTIRRMLSHESGLQGDPPGTDWTAIAYESVVDRNLERVTEIGTRVPPNSQQKYSNIAYQLLGEIVARVSARPYVEYVRDRILEPLGMSSTVFEPLPDALRSRTAAGYAGRFLSDELDPASIPPTAWAEGGLWSCVGDLARWIAFQLREDGGPRQGAQVLAGSTLKEMHTARYLGDDAWTEAWAITWYAKRRGDVIWVQHSGGLHGFTSNVCFDPKERVGAIVLLNGNEDADVLAMDLGTIAREAVGAAAPPIEPPPPLPDAYRPLLGIYLNREAGWVIRVEWRDGKLSILDPDDATWRPVLAPTGDPDAFVVEPGVRESGEPGVFRRLPDGRVVSLFLASETWQRLDPVSPPPEG